MKNTIYNSGFEIFVIIFASFLLLNSCGNNNEEESKREEEIKNTEIEKNISSMAKKYNAIEGWEEQLTKLSRSVYTLDLQKILIRKNNQPILFYASIEDIKEKEGIYLAYFHIGPLFDFEHFDLMILFFSPSVRFILECTEEQAERFLNTKTEPLYEKFAIVASIYHVDKFSFELTASTGDLESSFIEVNNSNLFIAKGIYLDSMYIGKYKSAKMVEK